MSTRLLGAERWNRLPDSSAKLSWSFPPTWSVLGLFQYLFELQINYTLSFERLSAFDEMVTRVTLQEFRRRVAAREAVEGKEVSGQTWSWNEWSSQSWNVDDHQWSDSFSKLILEWRKEILWVNSADGQSWSWKDNRDYVWWYFWRLRWSRDWHRCLMLQWSTWRPTLFCPR